MKSGRIDTLSTYEGADRITIRDGRIDAILAGSGNNVIVTGTQFVNFIQTFEGRIRSPLDPVGLFQSRPMKAMTSSTLRVAGQTSSAPATETTPSHWATLAHGSSSLATATTC